MECLASRKGSSRVAPGAGRSCLERVRASARRPLCAQRSAPPLSTLALAPSARSHPALSRRGEPRRARRAGQASPGCALRDHAARTALRTASLRAPADRWVGQTPHRRAAHCLPCVLRALGSQEGDLHCLRVAGLALGLASPLPRAAVPAAGDGTTARRHAGEEEEGVRAGFRAGGVYVARTIDGPRPPSWRWQSAPAPPRPGRDASPPRDGPG